jgi:hypothetical protein
MPKKPKTEQTPKGLTVPVPSRGEFFANLKKVAKPHTAPVEPTHGKSPRSRPHGHSPGVK